MDKIKGLQGKSGETLIFAEMRKCSCNCSYSCQSQMYQRKRSSCTLCICLVVILLLMGIVLLSSCTSSPSPSVRQNEDLINVPLNNVEVKEHCQPFSINELQVLKRGGRWQLGTKDRGLLDFANKEVEAREAKRVIQNYGINQLCSSEENHQGIQYFLSSGYPPQKSKGTAIQEECFAFDPEQLSVKPTRRQRWIIKAGETGLFQPLRSKHIAQNAATLIRKYQFTHLCSIGKPRASFEYLRIGMP